MDSALNQLTACELAVGISAGDFSVLEVVTAHLDRIDDVNPVVNAIVSMRTREEIVADAAAADSRDPVGPLHGLPVAVKDLEDVAGLPTSRGSLVSSKEPVAKDGHVARKLREAGAIIIGKTNTPEFGTGSHTFNEVFGVTRNPWDLDRTAGGSSGGAAAALAARMVPVADGSDLGGSLRNPAGMCNVVGMRPSVGRVADPSAESMHLRLGVSGPMARTVADVSLAMSALAGPDERDPLALPEQGEVFAGRLPTETTARLAWVGDLGLFTCEPEVLAICERAARSIESVGGTLVAASPDLSNSMSIFRVLRGAGYRRLGATIPSDSMPLVKETVRENIAYGRSLSIGDLLEADKQRVDLHRTMTAFFDSVDVLALPTAQVAAFPVEVEYPMKIDGVSMGDYLDWMQTCCIITPTGCPAISIPAGFTSTGLPVGIQLVARVGHDRQLLEIASALEAANPLHHLTPSAV
jgi:amidase